MKGLLDSIGAILVGAIFGLLIIGGLAWQAGAFS